MYAVVSFFVFFEFFFSVFAARHPRIGWEGFTHEFLGWVYKGRTSNFLSALVLFFFRERKFELQSAKKNFTKSKKKKIKIIKIIKMRGFVTTLLITLASLHVRTPPNKTPR